MQRSLSSTRFFVTPCILGAALGWSYDDDQRMAERVSVRCKKVKTLLFWLHCRPRHFFTCVLGSADFHCCTQNFAGLGKKTRSQLLFCFLKNSNRRETKTFQTHTSLQSIVKSSGRCIWISCLKIKS